MEIGSIDHFCPAFIHPDFLIDSLTVRAVTAAAGIIVDFGMAAIGTDADIAAQGAAFAPHDGNGGFFPDVGRAVSGKETIPPKIEDLLNFTSCHKYLPSYQEGL